MENIQWCEFWARTYFSRKQKIQVYNSGIPWNQVLLFKKQTVDHCWIYRRSWLKINSQVFNIGTCLIKYSKAQMFEILKSKEGLILKLSQLIKYFIWKKFCGKVCWKFAPETSPRPLFSFWNSLKYSQCVQESLL